MKQKVQTNDYKLSDCWLTYDDGNTIETIGYEGGKIIKDEENTFGARVTLESEGNVAPCSITIGIYSIMFHTDFFDSVEEGMLNFDLFKSKIENLIAHYLIDKNNRGNNWSKRSDELIDEIVSKI